MFLNITHKYVLLFTPIILTHRTNYEYNNPFKRFFKLRNEFGLLIIIVSLSAL